MKTSIEDGWMTCVVCQGRGGWKHRKAVGFWQDCTNCAGTGSVPDEAPEAIRGYLDTMAATDYLMEVYDYAAED